MQPKKNKQKTASVYIVILLFEINITFEKLKYTPLEWCYSDKWKEFHNRRLIYRQSPVLGLYHLKFFFNMYNNHYQKYIYFIY